MPVRVAAITLPGSGGTLSEREALAEAAIRGTDADLVVLPEAFLPGYAHVRADCGERARRFLTGLGRNVAMGFLDADGCWLGLVVEGRWWTYRKRFPTPAESRVWRRGNRGLVADTSLGRIGLALCADVYQLRTWRSFRGRVDLVAVAAAWPDYSDRAPPPGLGWLWRDSNAYRHDLLGRAARSLGAPVAFANADGPGFSGGSTVYDADGTSLGPLATVAPGTPGGPLRHSPRWAAFTTVYRWAAVLR